MKKLLLSVITALFILNCSADSEVSELINPSGENSSLSRLYTDNEGVVYLSWVEETNDLATLYYSKYVDNTWTKPVIVSSSDNWFVNWADFPSVIGYDGEPIAAHWLNKIPGNRYSYNVEVAGFKNDSISEPIVPHTDSTATEHGFVSMVALNDTSYYSIWLDGRNTSGGHGEHGDLSSAMTLRGALISISGDLLHESEIDISVCDCCNTSLARTSTGLIAAYRDRTSDEIRDIYTSKFENGVWETPKAVFNDNWEIAACPVNGPSIDVNGQSAGVAWFTMLNDKGAVKVAFSDDEGDTFSSPVIVDSDNPLGRVDLISNSDGSVWVSWITRFEDSANLELRKISKKGETLNSHTISSINPSRGSGFPQITRHKKGVMISWTELKEDSKRIRTSILQ